MREFTLVALCLLGLQIGFSQAAENPQTAFPGLFEDVQTNKIFPDQKTFADSIPLHSSAEILQSYRRLQAGNGFQLKAFVATNFIVPVAGDEVTAHLQKMWRVLRRDADPPSPAGSLLPLPFPYIVPGGRFREIYYWDSYFTMLGLEASGETEMIENMVNNFRHLIRRFGFIPNGNRAYYLSRSQPPYFSLMVELLAGIKGEKIFAEYLPEMTAEYEYWMDASVATNHLVIMPDGSVLNRYYDQWNVPRAESFTDDLDAASHAPGSNELFRELRSAAESGWDFSSRWFADGRNDKRSRSHAQTTGLVPVDLNCLLYHLELTLAKAQRIAGNATEAEKLDDLAAKRKAAINRFCWSPQKKFYVDFNLRTQQPATELTLAGVSPLFFKVATDERAHEVARRLRRDFLKFGGLVTTLKKPRKGFGEQWDFPNGWPPLQWLAIKGLENYGDHALAREIAGRWIALNVAVFQDTGRMMEKYDVVHPGMKAGGGEYKSEEGFGWTNGVLLKLLAIYGMPPEETSVRN